MTVNYGLTTLTVDIARWQKETFPTATAASAVEHLRREALELHAHYWAPEMDFPYREPEGMPHERAEEAADIFFMLVQLSTCEGFDLAKAVQNKLEKNRERKWKAPDEMGVVEHDET